MAFSRLRKVVPAIVLSTLALAGVALAPEARGRATYESTYGFERTWNASLRLVRVDMGLKVTEKDEGTGYLLFEYRPPDSGTKVSPGSLEVVRGADGEPVKVLVQLAQMPSFHERVMVDALAKKLRAEYGDPPPRRVAPARAKEKESGKDAGAQDDRFQDPGAAGHERPEGEATP